ncbi:hypothetical protein I307_03812 [Cryptococcus deuterogattii 99/473]|uniref:Uncharacterized protein n=1 Tax=Cryptococcus deuterogattii Ram5 TaxID=1296110 RepID=A0A0D0TQV0_9TREE|nr:hypothetical protein I309_02649 [Cryptococcus deuterogattii LA55]KIR37828.1 hypothetical protein I313_06194 [Cryptococcus deuterogattii Ram5]KIR93834.1 hypothetical protein I304_02515 [Cryptococcus deuterogattii CBS 10090]KIS00102.1 hypothetical protein L804_02744 [Cryptococcus deuterogattii 2001/935-1]KIY56708.1 hypothetical protein I307_03812 [Cryptococcus deuterogattii 99/473]
METMSGKSSVRRKQSNSLLQALGKPRQSPTSGSGPSSTTFSSPPSGSTLTLVADEFYIPISEKYNTSKASRSMSLSTHSHPPGSFTVPGGRRASSQTYSIGGGKEKGRDAEGKNGMAFRRPEDVYKVVRDRILSWSYMMEWYQGDAHWFNTVHISRTDIEQILGYKHLETRARNYYALGISLSALFDIPASGDFLRALIKLLEEWESFCEGSTGAKGVKSLFRGPRSGRKVTGSGSIMSDFGLAVDGSESLLLNFNLPFVPDFFQVHTTACSVVRDIYRKLLGMFLPPAPPSSLSNSSPSSHPLLNSVASLAHPSTVIHTARREPLPFASSKSPGASSLSPSTFSNQQGYHGAMSANDGLGGQMENGGDALLAFITGDVPGDWTLVGDGQRLTPQVSELFTKADSKLKKHFAILTREADGLAKRVIDDQINSLLYSLTPGSKAMKFNGNPDLAANGSGYTTAATVGRTSHMEEDRLREFGMI